jgi:excisionase family DNA binding protein
MSKISARRWVSPNQAAEHLGVTHRTIRNMIADGRLTAYRSGRNIIRLDANELDAVLKPYGGNANDAA